MTKEKSWVSTYIDIKGYKITATEMGDTVALALAKLLPTLVEIEKDGARAWVDRNNLNPSEKLDMDDVPEIPFGEEEDPFPVDPSEYGVVDRLMAAGDWEPGDTQEILITEYERTGDAIRFYKDDYEHAVHTHYINRQIGTDMMAKLFTDVWSDKFPMKGQVKFPGGDMIIKIEGANKRRDSGQGKGNVFRNLVGARRP